jgi:hypothetical protein
MITILEIRRFQLELQRFLAGTTSEERAEVTDNMQALVSKIKIS